MKIVRNNQFDSDPYLKELNIRVHNKEMLELEGILLFIRFSTTIFVSV